MNNRYLVIRQFAAVVCLAAFAMPAKAHQQWLAPNAFVRDGESAWVTFDHTYGDQRFQPGFGPSSYYSWWIVGPDGLKRNIPFMFLGKTRTVGEVELEQAGTYRLEAVHNLMPWTLIKVDGEETWQHGTREDLASYEIVRSRLFFNKVVAYVTLESTSRSALAATGDPLEIVFEDHPNELRLGEGFQVKVLASGKPLAQQEVRVFSEQGTAHEATATCTTDTSGICRIEATAAGRYLLATSTEGEPPTPGETDGYSYGYSVMVEVVDPSADAAEGE